jgi:hypothetical protein
MTVEPKNDQAMKKCLNTLRHERWMAHYLHQMWVLMYEDTYKAAMYSQLMYLYHLDECKDIWQAFDPDELDLYLCLSEHAMGLGEIK